MEFLHRRAADVDKIFNRIATIGEPLTFESLEIFVRAHGQFVSLLADKLRRNQKATSFASKYMHFHNEAVPLYDHTFAAEALKKLFFRQQVCAAPEGADKNYHRFAMLFWKAYCELRNRGLNPEVKLVDWWLVSSKGTPKYL